MAELQPIDHAPRQRTAGLDHAGETCFAHRPWLVVLTLVVVTFVVYQPVWHAGFIWDDDDHLTANPAMTAPGGLRLIWSSLAVSRYYPLTLTSFWVQRRLWGLNPVPYHVVNVALHAVNGVLIFLVLGRLRVPAPWLTAMLWVLHPVNVESVAWITELKNTQSGVFFFLALLCFLRFEVQAERRWYALALLCGLAALLSKPSTVVLPLVLLLCAWWERGRWQRVDALRTVPFFGLALAMSALTVIEQRRRILMVGPTEWHLGMTERFVTAGKAVWFYAVKSLWPVQLTFVYPRWKLESEEFLSLLPLAGLVAVGMILWVWRRQGWARAGLFGLGYFVVALLPVLGFFDVFYFRYSFVADHFQYLACIGPIALVAGGVTRFYERTGRQGRHIGAVAVTATLVVLGALTWRQGHVYRDVETLWRDTLVKNPGCWLAHNNLGVLLDGEGKVQEAVGHHEQALRIKPDYAKAHYNLGIDLFQLGKVTEAVGHYEQALRIKPDYAEAHNNLGIALLKLGRATEAISHYEQALRLRPDDAKTHSNLGNALFEAGKVTEAIGQYERALRIKPDLVEAQNTLAWLLATLAQGEGGDPVRAVGLARRACALTGNRVAAYVGTLAAAYAAAGRFNEAIATAQRAIELARAAGQTQLVSQVQGRLELYRAGRAYR